jgi:hypothetical protein
MEMFRASNGAVQQLQLVGTIPRESTLTGSVSRRPGGTGRTTLPYIAGAAGVRIRLKRPPFFFRATTLTDAESRSEAVVAAEPSAVAPVHFSRRRLHR